jgi:hypothetical protein
MKVTKQQAAEINLDTAIECFFRGNWVSAIHLAGAAEEIFGRLEEAKGGRTIPDFFWEKTDFKDLVSKKKDYIEVLNHFRDWIKHYHPDDPAEVEIQEPHVVIAIMRGCLAHATYTKQGRPSVAQFMKWQEENEGRIEKIVEGWPD